MKKQTESKHPRSNLHAFKMTGLSGHELLDVQVDFSPVFALENRQKLKPYSILPRFNTDGKCYTPGFVNPYEGLEEDQDLKAKFHEKVNLAITEIEASDILKAKPKKKKRKCWVCLCHFKDYQTHLQEQEHIHNIHYHKYSRLIGNLAQSFIKSTKKCEKKAHHKHKTRSSRIQDEQYLEL